MKTLLIGFVILFTNTFTTISTSVDIGYYATAASSKTVAYVEILSVVDISEIRKFPNGETVEDFKTKIQVRVMQQYGEQLNDTISLNFALYTPASYDERSKTVIWESPFINHSGKETKLKKGDEKLVLISRGRLVRAEDYSFITGKQKFIAAKKVQNYLNTTYPNQGKSIAPRAIIRVAQNKKKFKEVLYYDNYGKKFILFKKRKIIDSKTISIIWQEHKNRFKELKKVYTFQNKNIKYSIHKKNLKIQEL